MTRPLVSIVLPTFNRAKILPRAIDSILAQSCTDWELLVVDDGSTDETSETVEQYRSRIGRKIRYSYQRNAGPGAARNLGIDRANGKYVAFLDSDDEYMPTKLARQVQLMEARPTLGLAYCDSAFVDLDGNRHGSVFQEKTKLACAVPFDEVAPGLHVCRGSLFDWLIQEYFVSTISGMVRRDFMTYDIRFPVSRTYAEEWLFYLRIARIAPAGYVNEPLCLHHFTEGSLARTDKQANQAELCQLLYEIRDTFLDLNREQKKALHDNLALCNRQLGYDSYRLQTYREAARFFWDSCRAQPSLRTFVECVQSVLRSLMPQTQSAPGK